MVAGTISNFIWGGFILETEGSFIATHLRTSTRYEQPCIKAKTEIGTN